MLRMRQDRRVQSAALRSEEGLLLRLDKKLAHTRGRLQGRDGVHAGHLQMQWHLSQNQRHHPGMLLLALPPMRRAAQGLLQLRRATAKDERALNALRRLHNEAGEHAHVAGK
jgi:hypothetical protein